MICHGTKGLNLTFYYHTRYENRTLFARSTARQKRTKLQLQKLLFDILQPRASRFDIKRVLNNGMTGGRIVRISRAYRIPCSEAKEPGPTDHRQLTRRLTDLVPPDDADGAPVILPRSEVEVEVGSEAHNTQIRGSNEPLDPPNHGRSLVRLGRDQVVHDLDLAKPRSGICGYRSLCNLIHCRIGAASYVLNVEVQL